MISWEKPLLRKIEETAAEHASSLNDSEREQLQTILEAVHPSSSNSQEMTTMEAADEDDDFGSSKADGAGGSGNSEHNDRPPSVVLEAITLRGSGLLLQSDYASSIALEVPKNCFSVRL